MDSVAAVCKITSYSVSEQYKMACSAAATEGISCCIICANLEAHRMECRSRGTLHVHMQSCRLSGRCQEDTGKQDVPSRLLETQSGLQDC